MATHSLVTGGSGYIALELIRQLLDAGESVRATVRDLGDSRKLRPLARMQLQSLGRLELFEADLLSPGSLETAMDGCRTVYHVASPFLLPEKITDGRKQMLEPALNGTRNVLATVNATSSVERVVLTSTVGAIAGDYIDVRQMKNETLTEEYFNTSSTLETYPYHFSKVQAELEAWRIANAQSRWKLIVINPGLVLGPSRTTTSNSGSLFLLDGLLAGHHFYGLPDWAMCTVDVREVARAHIAAANTPAASGRYILAHTEMTTLTEMSLILRKVSSRWPLLPWRPLPNFLVLTFGPIWGLSRRLMRTHLGIRFKIDNSRSINELGIDYRPIEETLIDHYRSWKERRAGQAG